MRRHAPANLLALLCAFSLLLIAPSAIAASSDLTGKWIQTGYGGGTITIKQSGDKVTWSIASKNNLWSQTFVGGWQGKYVKGTFTQTEPTGTPKSYQGSITAFLTDPCHLMIGDVRVPTNQTANAYSLLDLQFTMTPCVKKVAWPPLPDALVPLVSVSNGCGGGDAGTDPKYGDDSEFVNSEVPFADISTWSKALKYHVTFREACMQHDAGYSHAKVNEMPLNGGKVIDYFNWTKSQIDDKFLKDMIKICDASIPKTAKIALNNCKNNGGFHTVSGAKTRYNIVASTTYSQKLWRGLGFYQETPKFIGAWTVHGFSTGQWNFYQNSRLITIRWTGGSGQPDTTGEFHGTVISHDKDSTIEGFYISTTKGVSTSPKAMSFTWSPSKPEVLLSSTGFTLTHN